MNDTKTQLLCDLRCLWRTSPAHRSLLGGVGLAIAAGDDVALYEQNIVAILLKSAGLWRDEYRVWLADVLPQPSSFEYGDE